MSQKSPWETNQWQTTTGSVQLFDPSQFQPGAVQGMQGHQQHGFEQVSPADLHANMPEAEMQSTTTGYADSSWNSQQHVWYGQQALPGYEGYTQDGYGWPTGENHENEVPYDGTNQLGYNEWQPNAEQGYYYHQGLMEQSGEYGDDQQFGYQGEQNLGHNVSGHTGMPTDAGMSYTGGPLDFYPSDHGQVPPNSVRDLNYSSESSEFYPDSQTALNVIAPQDQLSAEASFESESQLPASSSFAKLPHHPSPFDEITGILGQENERENPERLSLPASASHSRHSSCGGAKFVIGSSSEHLPSLDGKKDHMQSLSSKMGQEEEVPEAETLKVGVPEGGDAAKHDVKEFHADGGHALSGFVHKEPSSSLTPGEQDTVSFPPVARPGTMTGIPARNQFRKTSEAKPNPSSESGRDFASSFLHIPSNMPGSGEEEHDTNPVPLQYTGSSGTSAEEAAGALQNIDASQMHAGAAVRLHDEAPTPTDAEPAHSQAAETGQNYQLNIYAMPITPHPGSSFVPVCPKPSSNVDHKDWSRTEVVAGELGSSELGNPHSLEPGSRVHGFDAVRSRNQAKEAPRSPVKSASLDLQKDLTSSSSSGLPAKHKTQSVHSEEGAPSRDFGESPAQLHSVLHKHHRDKTMSPAATLWENPEPLAGVGICLIPAAGGFREDGTSQNAPAEHGKIVRDSGSSLPNQSVQLVSGVEQPQNTGTGPGKKTGGLASHTNNPLSASFGSGLTRPDDQVALQDASQHPTRAARDQELSQQHNAPPKDTADGGNTGVQSAPLAGYAAQTNVPVEAKSRAVTHVRNESVDSLTDEIVKSRDPVTNNADRKQMNHPTKSPDDSVPNLAPQPRASHLDHAKQYRSDGDRHEKVPTDFSVDAEARVAGPEFLDDSDRYKGSRVEHIVRQDSSADAKKGQLASEEARQKQMVQKPNDSRDGLSSQGKNMDKVQQNPRAGADQTRREGDHYGQSGIQQRPGPLQDNSNNGNVGRAPPRGNPSSESAVIQNPNSRPQDPHALSRSAQEYPSNPPERQVHPQHAFERPASKQEYPPDLQERPRSRQGYPKDPHGRPRSRQGYPEEDRPRSRQGYPEDRPRSRQGYPEDRPRSRQGYPEEDRPRSRQGYPEDPYDRPRSRQGYPEDDRPRSRQGGYPEEYRTRSRQGYPEDERPRSRQGYPPDSYNRPRSSQDYEAYDRQRPRHGSQQEPYDRPRSRQGYSDAYPEDPRGRQYYPEDGKQRPGGYSERPRSRQEYENYERDRRGYAERHPDDPRSKHGYRDDYDYKGHRGYGEEIYDRPRSRQHDSDPANTSYEESEKSWKNNTDRSRSDYYSQRNRLRSDRERYEYDEYYRDYYQRYCNYYYQQQGGYSQYPYQYQYPNQYDKGYLAEMAHYGQIPPYDPRYGYDEAGKPQSGSRHDSLRGSSPGQDQLSTAADNFAREFHQGSRPGSSFSGAEPSPIVGVDPGYASDPYNAPYSYRDEIAYHEPVRQRMTPQKFIVAHTRAAFGPTGQLVHVLPNSPLDGQPAVVELIDVASLLSGSPDMEELKKFPGPLIRHETHKNDVLLYCQKMALECRSNIHLIDRESAELIWHYLELLIKQNGTVIGTDLADLLLDGHEPLSSAYAKAGLRIACSREDLDVDEDGLSSSVSADRSVVNKSSAEMGIDETTDRFRHLLLHGRKKDALDLAMKRNLWGHALFLASKMDAKTHASIMTRFANVSMKMNDPLQTLYQIMSGRQPAAVTLISDDKWGDWRPHLSVILSNPTQKAELDKKSIVTLGDTLAMRGLFFGSQFCYLTARVAFGDYHKKSSKIVLLGASHSSPFEEFASNFAIQCTETYEYGLSLATPNYVLPTFQVYKFIYLLRLVDYGFLEEALKYAEELAGIITQSPTRYPPTLAKALYNLSYGLRQCDPQRLLMEETEDVAWFQQLHEVVLKIEAGSILHQSGQGTPVGGLSTGASSEVAEILGHRQPVGELSQQPTGFIGGTLMDGSNVMNYPDAQGQWPTMQPQQTVWNPVVQQQPYDQYQYPPQAWDPSQAQIWSQQAQFYQGQPTENVAPTNAPDSAYQGFNMSQSNGVDQPDGSTSQDLSKVSEEAVDRFPGVGGQLKESSGLYGYPMPTMDSSSGTSIGSFSSGIHNRQRTVSSSSSHSQQHLSSRRTSTSTVHGATPPSSPGRQASTASSPGASHGLLPPSSGLVSKDATNTDRIFQFGVPPPPSSAYTMSGTSAPLGVVPPDQRKRQVYPGEEPDENDRGTDSGVSKNDKSLGKNKDGNKSTSWLGGLFTFNRSTKPKEMILPDDKNPKIVWDKTKNRWVNMDEDPNEAEKNAQPPPPPKDAVTPMMSMPTPSESSSGNKFQRPKGRGARSQYVDVLSSSSKPSPVAPSNLLNLLPKSASMPPNVFIPNALAAEEEEKASRVQTEAAAPANTPAAPQVPTGQDQGVEKKAVQLPAAQPPLQADPTPMMANAVQTPANVLPMMFNPAQFNQNLSTPSQGSNSHLKYGQRRIYPK